MIETEVIADLQTGYLSQYSACQIKSSLLYLHACRGAC